VQLMIEVFDDGGIRVLPPAGRPGIATAAEMLRWVHVAAAEGYPIRVAGRVNSPLGPAVLELLPDGLADVTIEEREPSPWKPGWTSVMWAAEHGLVAETVDLLERGAPTTAPRRSETPYRLAMRRGHVPVMAALRDAGAEQPVLPRPPGTDGAVVMRPFIGWVFWWMAPTPLVVGLLAAIVTQSWLPAVVGVVVGGVVALLGAWAHVLAGRTVVAVDGPQLYSRRFWRWRGPVDLRNLVAIGRRESIHRRSPTLLRLANREHGEPATRRTTAAGFDPAIVEQLRQRPDVRVLTVYLAWNYLRPGLEHYVATYVDPQRTLISTSAQPLFREAGRS
jgi:hypothetical protein